MAERIAVEYERHVAMATGPGPFPSFLRAVAVAVGYTTVVLMALALSGIAVTYTAYRVVKALWS